MCRLIILNLGNGDEEDISGKDLVRTNTPDDVLLEISSAVKHSRYEGIPAEELFMRMVRKRGYEIDYIKPLDDISIFSCSADLY